MNYEELKDWCDDARRSVEREMERLQEQQRTMGNHLQVLEAAGELLAEIDRQKDELEQKQSEIDELTEQLEQKELEMTSMCQQYHSETDDLQRQLLEAKNLLGDGKKESAWTGEIRKAEKDGYAAILGGSAARARPGFARAIGRAGGNKN